MQLASASGQFSGKHFNYKAGIRRAPQLHYSATQLPAAAFLCSQDAHFGKHGAMLGADKRSVSGAVKLMGRGNGPVHEAGNWKLSSRLNGKTCALPVQECHLAFLRKWAPACWRCKVKCLRIRVCQ